MKAKRHAKILDIIQTIPVTTQEELQSHLKGSGFNVTQATVSRDIKELRLIKTLDANGSYRYSTVQQESQSISSRFHTLFSDAVLSVDYAGNMVVVKCLSGMASAVCAAMDALRRPDVVGTISGDDTYLCVMRDEGKAIDLVTEMKKLMRGK